MTTEDDAELHSYRTAIAGDCRIGACSLNNCLYPSCRKDATVTNVIPLSPVEAHVISLLMATSPRTNPLRRYVAVYRDPKNGLYMGAIAFDTQIAAWSTPSRTERARRHRDR